MVSILLWGGAFFTIVAVAMWRIEGHPSIDVLYGYLVYCAFVIYCFVDSYIVQWREESHETASNVSDILSRLDSLEKNHCSIGKDSDKLKHG